MKRKTATTEVEGVEEVVVGIEVEEEDVEKGEEVTKTTRDSQHNLIRHSNQILKIPPQLAQVLLHVLTSIIVILNLYVIMPINKILKVKDRVKKASALTFKMSIF